MSNSSRGPESLPFRLPARSASGVLLWIFLHGFVTGQAAGGSLHAQDQQQSSGAYGQVIRGVEYQSDRPLAREHLDPLLPLKPGDMLTRTGLKQAIQALYDTGRFAGIAVGTQPQADGIRLLFRLSLNLYFNRFAITGDVNLGNRFPSELVSLPVGQAFRPARLQAAEEEVARYLRDLGFLRPRLSTQTKVDEASRQVDVHFSVESGPQARITAVEIEGVPDTEMRAFRDKLSLKPGQKYRRDRIDRGLTRLKDYFLKRGFLAAEPRIVQTFDAAGDGVALAVRVTGFGRVRVEVAGFDIPRDSLRRLLPVLSGEGVQPEMLEEGAGNLREYLEEQGYPEADVAIEDERRAQGAGVVRYRIDAGEKVTVREVRFTGNHAFSGERLLAAIRIRPSRFLRKASYSISKLDSDLKSLRSLYQSAGYLNAGVIPLIRSDEGGRELSITFEFQEDSVARTRSVSLSGNRYLSSEAILPKLRLQAGAAYSPQIAERDRLSILSAYANEGFLLARVTHRAEGPDSVGSYDAVFEIEEGQRSFVNRVLLLGYERTREAVIRRELKIGDNEPLSSGKMRATEQGLYNLAIFDLVQVSPQNSENPVGYQDVVVRLAEGQRFLLNYGVGYQERDKVRGLFEITDMNFLGQARRADLRFRLSTVEQTAVLSFQRAKLSILPVNSYLSFSYSHEKEVYGNSQRVLSSYQYSRPLSGHSWAIGRVNFQNVRVSDYRGYPPIPREDQARNLTTISAIYLNDTRDNYFDAEKGFFTSTSLGVTPRWLGSSNYLSFYTQNSYHHPLPPSLNLAVGMRFGYLRPYGADSSVPISERFFAGGPSSLRGFRTDEAGPVNPDSGDPEGGNVLMVANLELRAPLYRVLQVEGFYDGGNVFRDFNSIRGEDFSHTVGIGLRIRTPIGPLRFEYGFNLNLPDRLHDLGYPRRLFFFTVGTPF